MHPLQRMRQLYRYDTDLQDAPLMGGESTSRIICIMCYNLFFFNILSLLFELLSMWCNTFLKIEIKNYFNVSSLCYPVITPATQGPLPRAEGHTETQSGQWRVSSVDQPDAYILSSSGTNAKDDLTWISAELFAMSFKILSSLQHPKRPQDRGNIPFPP